jgi:hypothetical protein
VVADDGPAAASLVTAASVAYFGEVKDLVLHASRDELASRSAATRIQVLILRQLLEPERLRAMSSEEVMAFAVTSKAIGEDLRSYDEIADVVVEGDHAVGLRAAWGRPDAYPLHLRREDGVWRFDLIPTVERMDEDFRRLAAGSHRHEETLARELVQLHTRRPLLREHLVPPFERETETR